MSDGKLRWRDASYFEYFTRPSQHCDMERYSDRLGDNIRRGRDNMGEKLQTLFSDAFDHHVEFNLDTPPAIQVLYSDARRIVSADSMTSYFIQEIYTPPLIFEQTNSRLNKNNVVDFDDFYKTITDSPITSNNLILDAIGSNRISFIIGEIGSGKSLLLSKVMMIVMKQQRSVSISGNSLLILPVYFNFEKEMMGGRGRLIDIDDGFYEKICKLILQQLNLLLLFDSRKSTINEIALGSYPNSMIKLIAIVKGLHKNRIRLLLILDNIDGYHYYYDKYTFFPEYGVRQANSIHKNIMELTSTLANGQYLGVLGITVIIAARRYVYEECLHTCPDESTYEFTGPVFQIDNVGEISILLSRISLLETAIDKLVHDSFYSRHCEYLGSTLERLKILFGIEESKDGYVSGRGAVVMRMIRNLCHHGNRDLVGFLTHLRLDYRKDSELIERFLYDKPHTLLPLYITDLRVRYTQKRGHFPNLFLVDSMVSIDPDFPNAHLPHKHTYWLKYLILAYVNARQNKIETVNQIKRLFVTLGGYEEHLFNLALGSLCTTKESRCLEPEAVENCMPRRVRVTSRGEALMKSWENDKMSFCFSFNYLQLVVDDYLMSYPISIYPRVYNEGLDLEYLFEVSDEYGKKSRDYLLGKMYCVLAFCSLLSISYEVERGNHTELFVEIRREVPEILPDFDEIIGSLLNQYKKIMSLFPSADSQYKRMCEYWETLKRGSEGVREQLVGYYNSAATIEE